MTTDSFRIAVYEALKTHTKDAGHVHWQNGVLRSFMYDGYWFPLRAIVNYARSLTGLEEVTSARCEAALLHLVSPFKPVIRQTQFVADELTLAKPSDIHVQKLNVWEAMKQVNDVRELIQGF